MTYVGIDVAKDKHDCYIVNSDGEILMPPKLPQKPMENARDSRKINALESLAVVEIPRSMR